MTNYCKYVNVFHGNGEIDLPRPEGIAAKWFFIKAGTGNTSPAATLPFGGMSVAPFSGGYPQGYGHNLPNSHSRPKRFPEGDKLLGFAHLQQSGTGAMGYYYNYAVVTPKYKNSEERRAPENEYGEPGYYSCDLEGIRCELTATNTVALHRYTFPEKGGYIEIDFDNNGLAIPGQDKRPVEKADLSLPDNCTVLADCVIEGIRLYFAVRGNGKAEISGRKAVFSDAQIIKVALSLVSADKALYDLNACPDFDTAKKAAHDAWNAVLSKIEIDADERTKRIFYSNLYHSFVKPCSRPGESFIYGDGKPFTAAKTRYNGIPHTAGQAFSDGKPFVYDFATLWDMYKTALPLILMTDRETGEDVCETLFSLCEAMGRIPNSLGLCDKYAEHDTQARMLGDYVLLTAYTYGYPIDPKRLLDTIKTDLLAEDKRDFTVDHKCPSTTFLLDMADCCALAARLARKTGDTELAELFESYAGLWTLAYDEKTGLLTADSPYYEGTLYNYSFRQMVDMKSRIDLAGGKERFCGLLDRFFGYGAPDTVQPTDPDDYSPVAEGIKLGRFEGFNNESDTEAPFTYTLAGRHDRTCEIIRAGLEYMFAEGAGGIPGNNDSGALSSLYVLAAVGLFPVAGQDLFILASPIVSSAKIRLWNGNTLEIRVRNQSDDNIFVSSASFNGKTLDGFTVPASELMHGGVMEFVQSGERRAESEVR